MSLFFRSSPYRSGLLILATSCILSAAPVSQPQVALTNEPGSIWNASWSGVATRTYFVQLSHDLVNWQYAPLIDHGMGLKSRNFPTANAPKIFLPTQIRR